MTNPFSLDHLRAIIITGSDALAFGNAQLTIDVTALSDGVWRPAAWCDPKGRVLSTMMARSSEGDVELALPASLAETVRKQLQRYTIGRDVQLSAPRGLVGLLSGPSSMPRLAVDPDRGMAIMDRADSDPDALARWRRLDLCAGMPWLTPETSAQHLPQSLGLERLQALAFDKGCYPGQEVIARLHYRGTSKYRLLGLKLENGREPPAHARVDDHSGKRIGHCVETLPSDHGRVGLAVLSTAVELGDEIRVCDDDRHESAARVTAPDALC